jgi:hypothetical protein
VRAAHPIVNDICDAQVHGLTRTPDGRYELRPSSVEFQNKLMEGVDIEFDTLMEGLMVLCCIVRVLLGYHVVAAN